MSGAYRFTFEPVFLALAAVAAVLYIRAARREHPGAGRITVFVLGLALSTIPVNSPLETLSAHYLLLAHRHP